MATLTLSIPDELKAKLDAQPDINWSEYLKARLVVRLQELQRFENIRRAGKL